MVLSEPFTLGLSRGRSAFREGVSVEMNPPGLNFTPLTQAAGQMHELFMAYVEAGFTREEALQLLIGMLRPESTS